MKLPYVCFRQFDIRLSTQHFTKHFVLSKVYILLSDRVSNQKSEGLKFLKNQSNLLILISIGYKNRQTLIEG